MNPSTRVKKYNDEKRQPGEPLKALRRGLNVEMAEKRERATDLRKRGLTFTQIAAEMGMSRSGVFRLVDVQEKLWLERAHNNVEEYVNEQIGQIDVLTDAIWDKAIDGDLDAIDRVIKLMTRKSSLLGLDAPKEKYVHQDTQRLDLKMLATLNPNELNTLYRLVAKTASDGSNGGSRVDAEVIQEVR